MPNKVKKTLDDLRREAVAAAQKVEAQAAVITGLEADPEATPEAIAQAVAALKDLEAAALSALDIRDRAAGVEALVIRAAAGGDQVGGRGGDQGGAPVAGDPVPAVAGNPADRQRHIGMAFHALASAKGDVARAVSRLENEGHSAVAAMVEGASDGAGGVLIPTQMSGQIIEMLRPRTVVRAGGARSVPMPAGKLRSGRQTAGAVATYGDPSSAGRGPIPSAPAFDAGDKSFKQLTCLVPVKNDFLRMSALAGADFVMRDMLQSMQAAEDLAMLRSDGSGLSPVGLINWALAEHTFAPVNATFAAVDAMLRGMVARVVDADVAIVNGGWIMRGAAKEFLAGLQNTQGNLAYPSIDASGRLKGYPIYTTSQLPNNLGVGGDETEILFVDFDKLIIGETKTITFASSDVASFWDPVAGRDRSAFQEGLTLFRSEAEHDFAPEFDQAIALGRGVGWAL